VYEIDLPRVLGFKADVLTAHGARPRAVHRTVAADHQRRTATNSDGS
jgi:O-methyltransferase involved in polyketide biosynthesis